MSKQQKAWCWYARIGVAALLTLVVGAPQADESTTAFAEPPWLAAKQDAVKAGVVKAVRAGTNLYSAGAESAAIKAGREIHYILPIKYTEGFINNPATGQLDRVRLRSFGDRFLAPTIVMRPGQTVRIGLQNQLPKEPDCAEGHGINQPHCFNITNLHSHGLWVSPTGNSDNVLLSLNPGVDFEYEYNVPEDHPAGTFWYHPHRHGSTAMQVGSGMAGVLVVRGERAPTPTSNGDLDVLLKPFEPRAGDYAEVMLFQQIPYACFNAQREIQKDASGRWICNEGQTGEVEQFATQMGFGTWGPSGRYTLINGVARPRIAMQAGRLYRWRAVHSGVREGIALRIRKIGDSALITPAAASAEERADEVVKACTGVDVTLFEVAADGLTRGQIFPKVATNLQPGYRSDILFTLPEEGAYCVYDDSATATGSVSAQPENPKVLAIIDARGGRPIKDQQAFLLDQLLASANELPADVRNDVKGDLRNMLLTRFVPHPEITQQEIEASALPVVPIEFNISGTPPTVYEVNGQSYQPDRIDQTLILGKAQTWRLSSALASHPFHIHVNPFQVVSVRKKGADGKPTGPEISDGQYAGMLGTWKDTLFVQSDVVIETRTRYQRYIGEFVLHCHILDHEDQGMMQNVQIVLPNGNGGAQLKGHH
jgi:L-ascorbate oxidase